MRSVSVEQLAAVRASTLGWLSAHAESVIQRMLAEMRQEYRGTTVTPLSPQAVEMLLGAHGLTPDQVSIRIVRVNSDLSNQVYARLRTTVCIAFLGESQSVPRPTNGRVRRGYQWFPAMDPDLLTFFPGVTCGYMVKPDGVMYFLEVASPPIGLEAENDDYEPRGPTVTDEV